MKTRYSQIEAEEKRQNRLDAAFDLLFEEVLKQAVIPSLRDS